MAVSVVSSICKSTSREDLPAAGSDLATPDTVTHVLETDDGMLRSIAAPKNVYADEVTLTGVAANDKLDLTALPGLATVDFSGRYVQLVHILAGADNSGTVTFEDGAANPYSLFGAAGKVVLGPKSVAGEQGCECLLRFGVTSLAEVTAGAKEVKVTGTASDTYKIHLVAG